MKKILILIILFLSGCSTGSAIKYEYGSSVIRKTELKDSHRGHITYKSYENHIKELEEKRDFEMWTDEEFEVQKKLIGAGGAIYVYTRGITLGSAKTKWWQCKVKTINGEEIAVIEPKPEQKLSKIEENIIDEIKDLKKDIPMKQTNLNRVATNLNFDDIEDYQIQKNKGVVKQIIAKNDVWIEIKDFNENILISTVLKKDEFFKLPNDGSKVIISASNAGSLFLNDGNNNFTGLGSFGDILDSVQLNSLITNH